MVASIIRRSASASFDSWALIPPISARPSTPPVPVGSMPYSEGKSWRAIGSWSAAVGAMILARAVEDKALSDEILAQTKKWITAALNP